MKDFQTTLIDGDCNVALIEFERLGELEDDLLEATYETGSGAVASSAPITSPLAIKSPRDWRTSGGKRKKPVWGIVVHTTGSGPAAMAGKPNRWSCKSAIDCVLALYGPGGMEGFPHYVIGYDGSIYAVTPENYVAWHAGWTKETGGRAGWAHWSPPVWWSSVWGSGRTPLDLIAKDAGSPNTRHIGIELLGGPSGWGFTEAQYRSLARLAADIERRHGLNLGEPPNPRLLGHEDVNPLTTKGGRADARGGWDPGAHRQPSQFSWKRLGPLMREARAAARGIGSTANPEFELEDELEQEEESEFEFEVAVPRRPPMARTRPVFGNWLIPFVSRAIPQYRDAKGKLQSTSGAVCVSDAAWRQTAMDLIVFFHGDQIDAPGNPCKHDFDPEKIVRNFRLDAQINGTGRKIAIAVPVIHWTRGESGFARTAARADDRFPGKWSAENLNKFIEEVRDEIGQRSGVKPTITRLIIAGHSHAYAVLSPLAAEFNRGIAATKAGALTRLSEVWALDSTYGTGSVSALDAWARALPRGRIIAVLNRDRSAGCTLNGYFKPVECWGDYYRSRRPPPNLKMCKVGEPHCVIPTKYIGQLLSSAGCPPGWCQG
jgi:hypothetical protein